tara:strand:+ start:58 stop:474 length:417 start_codon:yes stop_codon:yes gene_type:complete
MRRDFLLPQEDIVFLDGLGLIWETIADKRMQWVIIHDYPVPYGYNHGNVSVAIKIDTGYPRTQLDMAYLFPALQRLDGKQINAICNQAIVDKQYQRWSRHRTTANPWREGVDDLSTHLSLVSFWFEQEFKKRENGATA